MENEKVLRLRELKERLLNTALRLKDRLNNEQENEHHSSINFNSTLLVDDENDAPSKSLSARHEAKLCEISGQATGIGFKDIDKKWLRDNIYLYTAKVVTKTASFDLELTVLLEDSDYFEINNVMCRFKNIDNCLMLEIAPWFQKITDTKNFSLLMSALSDYNEYNILRSKILRSMEAKKYARIEQYTKENGGVLVYICSPKDTRKDYVTFQWTLKFLDVTWHIENFFIVKTTDIGLEFSKENHSLLKKFCDVGLTKRDLIELWDALCVAIDTYHTKSVENVEDS